jgi:hypothetical protein
VVVAASIFAQAPREAMLLLNMPSTREAQIIRRSRCALSYSLYTQFSDCCVADQQQHVANWQRGQIVGESESRHSSGLQLQSAQRMLPWPLGLVVIGESLS